MNNRTVVLSSLVVLACLFLACLPAFGDAPQDLRVTLNMLPVGFEVIVRELPLKPAPAGQIDGRKVFPFTNLDVFLRYTLAVGTGMLPSNVKIPNPDIAVSIPFKYIMSRTSLKAEQVKNMDLAFWDSTTKTWKKVGDLKDEISAYSRDDDSFNFRILAWPIDERPSACY